MSPSQARLLAYAEAGVAEAPPEGGFRPLYGGYVLLPDRRIVEPGEHFTMPLDLDFHETATLRPTWRHVWAVVKSWLRRSTCDVTVRVRRRIDVTIYTGPRQEPARVDGQRRSE